MAADTAGWLVEITPCVRYQGLGAIMFMSMQAG
jgi:hypothetical protein